MSLVTKQAPDFTATAVMPDGTFENNFKLSDYKGKYIVLFFYPLDFTFVCPTEIIAFDEKIEEFIKRNTEIIGVSTDSEYSHFAWRNTSRKNGGIGQINYPLVADIKKQISKDYGILYDESIALRGLFLIDKEGIIRHEVVNDLPLGRSIKEALRMVDSLQTYEKFGEVCPADYNAGEKTMKPSQEGLKQYASSNF